MNPPPAKTLIWISLLAFCSFAWLFANYIGNQYRDEWEKQHGGIPTTLPTPTSYPPLDPAERQPRVAELFHTNGDCRFPCWWGIVPGTTTWEETHRFLSPFMDTGTQQYLSDDGRVFTQPFYGAPGVSIDEVIHEDDLVFGLLIRDVAGDYLSKLKLSSIFQMYGRPEQIYIRSPHYDRGDRSCQGAFELFLYYPADHFAVRYSYLSYPMNRTFQVCELDRPDSAEFYLWDPAFDYSSFEEAIRLVHWYPDQPIVPVEEATSWTSGSFYQAFQSQEGTRLCIEAPPYDWSYLPGIPAGQTPYGFCNQVVPTDGK